MGHTSTWNGFGVRDFKFVRIFSDAYKRQKKYDMQMKESFI